MRGARTTFANIKCSSTVCKLPAAPWGHLRAGGAWLRRRVIILVKAGAPVDSTIDGLVQFMEAGDIIIDGGNEWCAWLPALITALCYYVPFQCSNLNNNCFRHSCWGCIRKVLHHAVTQPSGAAKQAVIGPRPCSLCSPSRQCLENWTKGRQSGGVLHAGTRTQRGGRPRWRSRGCCIWGWACRAARRAPVTVRPVSVCVAVFLSYAELCRAWAAMHWGQERQWGQQHSKPAGVASLTIGDRSARFFQLSRAGALRRACTCALGKHF